MAVGGQVAPLAQTGPEQVVHQLALRLAHRADGEAVAGEDFRRHKAPVLALARIERKRALLPLFRRESGQQLFAAVAMGWRAIRGTNRAEPYGNAGHDKKQPRRMNRTHGGNPFSGPQVRVFVFRRHRISPYGCATNVERLPENQPGQYPHQGVPGDRRPGHLELQPAPRRVPDAHSAETLVSSLRDARSRTPRSSRGIEFEKGRYVVVEEEDLEKVRVESTRVINLEKFTDDAAIDPIYPRAAVLPRARRPGRQGGLCRHPRGDEGQSRHRQGRAVRPRVPDQGPAAGARPGHVHASTRQRNPQHGRDRRARRRAGLGQARGGEAGAPGHGHVRRGGRLQSRTATSTRQGLRDIIDAKIEGREIVAPEVEAPPKVVNLMDALRKSLDTISASKKKMAARPAGASKKRAQKKRA